MNDQLILKEKYYEEAPMGYKDVNRENAIEQIELDDTFEAYERPENFFIGKDGDIVLKKSELYFNISHQGLTVTGEIGAELVYWNQRRLRERRMRILKGDCLLAGSVKLYFFPDHIRVYARKEDYTTGLLPVAKQTVPFRGFPDYKRSPRIIKRVPKDKVEIKAPPEMKEADKGSLAMLILPSLATTALTVGIGILMGRGAYLFISAGAAAITICVSLIRFFSDRKERIETNKKNQEAYEAYLLKKRKELYGLYQKEAEAYSHNFPTLQELNHLVHHFDSRIYERLASDQDFLTISIGKHYSNVSYPISLPDAGVSAQDNQMYEQAAQLGREYSMIWSNVPVDLKRSHLGLVGSKAIIHQQLHSYLCQIAMFHSYRDLQIIVMYDDKYAAQFSWMKWLPHCSIQALNVRGLICSEKARDQVLNSLNQILKERQQKLEESKKEAKFLPHFLFVIDEPRYIMDHSIMEYLNGEGSRLSFSIIYTSYLRANLPDYIDTSRLSRGNYSPFLV